MRGHYLILLFSILAILGCETTGDPRQGGLFGWSEDKAIGRQNFLKQTRDAEERKMEESRAESKRLENDRAALQAELDRQRKLVAALDADLNKIQKQIKAVEGKKIAKEKDVASAKKEHARLQAEINQIKSSKHLSVEEKKKKIDALNNDIHKLLQIIDAL